MKFAWCPSGMFLMGGNGQDNNPQHRVTISKGFWMGIFPVTQAQWQAVMGYNPSHFLGPDRPVEMVSWDDCQEFCQKMTELTGKPIRLPTEAEWEYACRAGTNSEYFNGKGREAFKQVGWCEHNSGWQTHPVGEKKAANPWGLFDVHGNVWEWCQDMYLALGTDSIKDPINLESGEGRVARGGSWYSGYLHCRAAYRHWDAPSTRKNHIGLRVCFHQD